MNIKKIFSLVLIAILAISSIGSCSAFSMDLVEGDQVRFSCFYYVYHVNKKYDMYHESLDIYNSSGDNLLDTSQSGYTCFSNFYKNMVIDLLNNHYANITSTYNGYDYTNDYEHTYESIRVVITSPTTLNF